MQAHIVEKLLHAKTEEPANGKDLKKFSKLLGEDIVHLFKNRLSHEAELVEDDISRVSFADFAQSPAKSNLLALVHNTKESVNLVFKYDARDVALLVRLIMGGDLEAPVEAVEIPFTATELGIVHLFSQLVVNVIGRSTGFSAGPITIMWEEDLDLEELPAFSGLNCRYEIKAGASVCELKFAVPESWMAVDDRNGHRVAVQANKAHRNDLMGTNVAATVQLAAQPKTLNQILNLRVGDSIPLAGEDGFQAKLFVRDQAVFTGQLGRSKDIYCFRIDGSTNTKTSDLQH